MTTKELETLAVAVCARCGHLKSEHGRECDLVSTDSKVEVCLLCTGWDEYDGTIRKPTRHRFVEVKA